MIWKSTIDSFGVTSSTLVTFPLSGAGATISGMALPMVFLLAGETESSSSIQAKAKMSVWKEATWSLKPIAWVTCSLRRASRRSTRCHSNTGPSGLVSAFPTWLEVSGLRFGLLAPQMSPGQIKERLILWKEDGEASTTKESIQLLTGSIREDLPCMMASMTHPPT